MLLVDNFLRSLIAVKSKATTGTFHDNGRTQPTEYAGLVVLRGIQSSDNDVVWIVKCRTASWATSLSVRGSRESQGVGAVGAEDMAVAISTVSSRAFLEVRLACR
jgi:hypothetical protein